MNRWCPQCGVQLAPHSADYERGVCLHHLVYADDWAAANRKWCDFFHRGIVDPYEPTDIEDWLKDTTWLETQRRVAALAEQQTVADVAW